MKLIEFIKCMQSVSRPIEVLIHDIRLVQQDEATMKARREILKEQRVLLAVRIKEMQKTLDILDNKIVISENAILKKEKDMIMVGK